MAKYGSSSVVFLIDGYNFLAAKLKSLNLKISSMAEMSSGLGDDHETNTPVGKQSAALQQGEAFFDTATASLHDAMASKLGATPQDTARVVCLGVMGNTVGAVLYGISGIFSVAYDAALQMSKLTKANAEHLMQGLVELGVIVQPLASKTADWNTHALGTPVDYTTSPNQYTVPITSSDTSNPAVVTTPVPHGLTTGQVILIAGATGASPDINGEQTVTVIDATSFSLDGVDASAGSGGTGGSFVRCSTVNGGAGYQQVVDFSGFTGYVGKLRHSADESTYADLVTFTNVTTAHKAERVAAAGTVNRYLVHDGDATGTGSLSVLSGFCRS